MSKTTIALCISDVHLSDKPPRLRAGESDWIGVQLSYFDQLEKLWDRLNCPQILIAGDVFDKPSPSLQLINRTSEKLKDLFPQGYVNTIYGNHDLPYHRLENKHRCGLFTLAQTGAVNDLEQYGGKLHTTKAGKVWFQPFSWGKECCSPVTETADYTVAVVHKYAWEKKSQAYTGASDAGYARKHGFGEVYDFVHYGDNHQQWTHGDFMVNPGAFIRRTKVDQSMEPAIYGLCVEDGQLSVERHPLDTEADMYDELEILLTQVEFDTGLKSALERVQGEVQDVPTLVKSLLDDESSPSSQKILAAIQESLE